MAIKLDPEGTEKRLLHSMVGSFAAKRVLEVGCGSGRLTWRYAEQAQSVIGIDPNPDSIAEARANTPSPLQNSVAFYPFGVLDYTPPQGTQFEVAILSWSLC